MSMTELVLILAIALVVLGPEKLPTIARGLGRAMREFRKATREIQTTLQVEEVRRTIKERVKEEREAIEKAIDSEPKAKASDSKAKAGRRGRDAPADDPYAQKPSEPPTIPVGSLDPNTDKPAPAEPAREPEAPPPAEPRDDTDDPQLDAYLSRSDRPPKDPQGQK